MSRVYSLIVTDASPLITPAVANELDVLLRAGVPVKFPMRCFSKQHGYPRLREPTGLIHGAVLWRHPTKAIHEAVMALNTERRRTLLAVPRSAA